MTFVYKVSFFNNKRNDFNFLDSKYLIFNDERQKRFD